MVHLHTVSASALERAGRDVSRLYLGAAAVSLVLGLAAGLGAAAYYTPAFSALAGAGLGLQALRPLHTGATVLWIYLAGMAAVHGWLFEALAERDRAGDPHAAELGRRLVVRSRAQLLLWSCTAVVAAGCLLAGWTSGREYMEWPPILSFPIGIGWLLWVWSFVEVTRLRLREAPVHAWMWATSAGLFLWTFGEAHAWLLPWLQARPLQDIAVQWKAYGSLVGSYNLLVYGALSWLNARLARNTGYARSNLAFSLFLLGILNSFTNYGHHVYHLPVSPLVKWVAFLVSMTEVVILGRVVLDCLGLANKWNAQRRRPVVAALLVSTTGWTAVQLALAVVISIPPLNSYVHGTLVVPAHAMGSLLGIDTMALLAVGTWAMPRGFVSKRAGLACVVAVNVGLFGLWGGLLAAGVRSGVGLVRDGVLPWSGNFPAWLGPTLLVSGALLTVGLVGLVIPWLRPRPSAVEVACNSAS